jgi:hypothetical protein
MSEVKEVKPSRKGDIVKVILAILAVLMGTYIFVDPGKSEFKFDSVATTKIDSLEKVNIILKEENVKLDSTLAAYKLMIYDLDFKLSNIIKERSKASEYYKDKMAIAAEYTPTEVDSFFMTRYEYAGESEY